MRLLVALDDRALKYDEAYKIHYVDGQPTANYYFDEKTAQALEDDGFLTEMWDKFDAMFDWGILISLSPTSVLASVSGCLIG
ncbi:Protein of unknown function [Lactobacillus equicursoris DSM 19284 = JCM 14600 = CIP 110162]|uniref:hypothetical protein n=1 Tax=Lactobacillus equicursoris TaxID=420645 RepID=UPI000284011E|nr:hypothetical protein [Lactobacillus equicursoris]CCK85650.1 Protein of unknown function [Lactobacillus equicursoris DSM 19284 = JCM 14600 = CIP 110162]